MQKPLRVVVWIEDRVGPNGGQYWSLKLECGHIEFRRKKTPNAWYKWRNFEPVYAPEKVKCLSCGISDEKRKA